MANDPQQETTPGPREADPPYGIPPMSESFGSAFPEAASAAFPSYANAIPVQNALPEQRPFKRRQEQAAYESPQPYGGMPYAYAVPFAPELYGRPPEGFYTPPVAPLPLWKALRKLPEQYWHVLTHPKAATFVQEQGKAAWNIIWAQLFMLGVIDALALLLLVFLEFFLLRLILPSNNLPPMFSQMFIAIALVLVLCVLVLVPLSFFIGAGIFHLVAKAFGGQSKFLPYAYNYALIIMPISFLSLVLSIIPFIGSLASLAGGVYQIILLIYMTMGIQRLSGGRATATVLIPVGAGILFVVGLFAVYFYFLFSLISSLPH
ncbi:MAG TPA: Yip1 family protein [Ktedonobacteraceae bacterium]|jgi:hypothetical protein